MIDRRACGILLPIFSLPSPYGIGDLGADAYRFVDFLSRSGQNLWQVLPLHPTSPHLGNSPYASDSAFAANPLLISPQKLVEAGYLLENELADVPDFDTQRADYPGVIAFKYKILTAAFKRFTGNGPHNDFDNFCMEQSSWLDDYTLFAALKEAHGGKVWTDWPQELRDRNPAALENARREFAETIQRFKFYQFLFFRQWAGLKTYCHEKDVSVIGDIPIYVDFDSADAWSNQGIFKLGEDRRPTHVAGVPPDYFSKTGQLWGNPVYNWETLRSTGFDWWVRRLEHMFALYDIVRIDHFRGLIAYWEVPAENDTAVHGTWVPVPHEEFFKRLKNRFDGLPIIAEDLGTITDDVRAALKNYGLPGMKLLLFAFGEDNPEHPYLPYNFEPNCVVYTGTHDNNTARGWFDSEASPEDIERLALYAGQEVAAENVHHILIRLAYASVAKWAVLPLQDLIGLGEEARINLPATLNGNWSWRFVESELTDDVAEEIRTMAITYGRYLS
jgi:4-alpha-glucanotransferase